MSSQMEEINAIKKILEGIPEGKNNIKTILTLVWAFYGSGTAFYGRGMGRRSRPRPWPLHGLASVFRGFG